jgi:hypothetical protein
VEKVDTSGPVIKMLFHYVKSSIKYDEWIEFGSARISKFNSRVPFQEKKVRKKKNMTSNEIVLSHPIDAPQPTDDLSIRLDRSAAPASSSLENTDESQSFLDTRDHGLLASYDFAQISSDAMAVDQLRSPKVNQSTSFPYTAETTNGVDWTEMQNEPVQQVERPFVDASRNKRLDRDFCVSNTPSREDYRASVLQQPNGLSGTLRSPSFSTYMTGAPRPPSFTTFRSDSVPSSSLCSHPLMKLDGIPIASESRSPTHFVALSSGGRPVALSGLDMLAAVTTDGAFANLLDSAQGTTTPAPVQSYARPHLMEQSFQQQHDQAIEEHHQSLRIGLHHSREPPYYSEHSSGR